MAAGSGSRLGAGGPKALVEVASRPLLTWSLEAHAAAGAISATVVVAPAGHEERMRELAGPGATVVTGGETRAASVAAGLGAAASELVAVHDAARPLVTPDLIDAVVLRLAERPDAAGAIAACALADTVKRAREPRRAEGDSPRGGPTIAKTESREHLWAAQTPQVFRSVVLRAAHDADPREVAAATDDAMLVERAGGKVLIEPAPASNLKVTTPDDLRIAELLLSSRS